MAPATLLQGVLEDRQGPLLALLVLGAFALLGLYFILRSRLDQSSGRTDEEANYIFGLGENPPLLESPAAKGHPASATPLGAEGLATFISKAESHGDLGVVRLLRANGDEVPYELAARIPDDIAEVELTSSRGTIWLDIEGHLRAQPPLDDAVRRDLGDLLTDVIGKEDARADRRTRPLE